MRGGGFGEPPPSWRPRIEPAELVHSIPRGWRARKKRKRKRNNEKEKKRQEKENNGPHALPIRSMRPRTRLIGAALLRVRNGKLLPYKLRSRCRSDACDSPSMATRDIAPGNNLRDPPHSALLLPSLSSAAPPPVVASASACTSHCLQPVISPHPLPSARIHSPARRPLHYVSATKRPTTEDIIELAVRPLLQFPAHSIRPASSTATTH